MSVHQQSSIVDVFDVIAARLGLPATVLSAFVGKLHSHYFLRAHQLSKLSRSELVELVGLPLGIAIEIQVLCGSLLSEELYQRGRSQHQAQPQHQTQLQQQDQQQQQQQQQPTQSAYSPASGSRSMFSPTPGTPPQSFYSSPERSTFHSSLFGVPPLDLGPPHPEQQQQQQRETTSVVQPSKTPPRGRGHKRAKSSTSIVPREIEETDRQPQSLRRMQVSGFRLSTGDVFYKNLPRSPSHRQQPKPDLDLSEAASESAKKQDSAKKTSVKHRSARENAEKLAARRERVMNFEAPPNPVHLPNLSQDEEPVIAACPLRVSDGATVQSTTTTTSSADVHTTITGEEKLIEQPVPADDSDEDSCGGVDVDRLSLAGNSEPTIPPSQADSVASDKRDETVSSDHHDPEDVSDATNTDTPPSIITSDTNIDESPRILQDTNGDVTTNDNTNNTNDNNGNTNNNDNNNNNDDNTNNNNDNTNNNNDNINNNNDNTNNNNDNTNADDSTSDKPDTQERNESEEPVEKNADARDTTTPSNACPIQNVQPKPKRLHLTSDQFSSESEFDSDAILGSGFQRQKPSLDSVRVSQASLSLMVADESEFVSEPALKKHVELVRKTWRQVLRAGATASKLFYFQLFELRPDLEALFGADAHLRELKFVRMIDSLVTHLDFLGNVTDTLEEMAVRHISYDVLPEDYASVGDAIVYTIQKTLGPKCTPEVYTAWKCVFDIISATMIEAAQPYYSSDESTDGGDDQQ